MRTTKTTFKSGTVNTMTLTGLSLLWGVMLGLIPAGWSVLAGITLFIGFGAEVKKTNE